MPDWKKNTGNLDKAGVGVNLVVIRFRDAKNPAVPLRSRQDHPLRQARLKEIGGEVLVSSLQMQSV